MSWNYGNDPSNSDRDKVRLLVGDTDSSDQLITDEEINWAISREGTIFDAAALISQTIAAQFARNPDKEIRDLQVSFSQTISNYTDLAEHYRDQATTQGSWKALTKQLSQDAKDNFDTDDDLIQPVFERGQHEVVEA